MRIIVFGIILALLIIIPYGFLVLVGLVFWLVCTRTTEKTQFRTLKKQNEYDSEILEEMK